MPQSRRAYVSWLARGITQKEMKAYVDFDKSFRYEGFKSAAEFACAAKVLEGAKVKEQASIWWSGSGVGRKRKADSDLEGWCEAKKKM